MLFTVLFRTMREKPLDTTPGLNSHVDAAPEFKMRRDNLFKSMC